VGFLDFTFFYYSSVLVSFFASRMSHLVSFLFFRSLSYLQNHANSRTLQTHSRHFQFHFFLDLLMELEDKEQAHKTHTPPRLRTSRTARSADRCGLAARGEGGDAGVGAGC
jgi:hypothetical protein